MPKQKPTICLTQTFWSSPLFSTRGDRTYAGEQSVKVTLACCTGVVHRQRKKGRPPFILPPTLPRAGFEPAFPRCYA